MRAEFGKFGPKHDYREAHVVMNWQGRELLGTIKDVYRNEQRCVVLCKVYHFCGDAWPIDPALSCLEILDRTAV